MFEVEQMLLFNSRTHGKYMQEPRSKFLQNTNVVDKATHFRRKGFTFITVLARAYSIALGNNIRRIPDGQMRCSTSHIYR